MLIVQGRGEMAVKIAFTAVLFHQCALDTVSDCSFFCTGKTGNVGCGCRYCTIVISVCYGYRD